MLRKRKPTPACAMYVLATVDFWCVESMHALPLEKKEKKRPNVFVSFVFLYFVHFIHYWSKQGFFLMEKIGVPGEETPTISPKIGMTSLLEVKIHHLNRGSNPGPLTLVISSLGQNAPALYKPTELLAAAKVFRLFRWTGREPAWPGGKALGW